jgi:hypothetical protein
MFGLDYLSIAQNKLIAEKLKNTDKKNRKKSDTGTLNKTGNTLSTGTTIPDFHFPRPPPVGGLYFHRETPIIFIIIARSCK